MERKPIRDGNTVSTGSLTTGVSPTIDDNVGAGNVASDGNDISSNSGGYQLPYPPLQALQTGMQTTGVRNRWVFEGQVTSGLFTQWAFDRGSTELNILICILRIA